MKKLNKKGFTLVELLAVIVILSVLMLIALPSVINIMNNARDDAFRDEALSFISAAETQYASDGGEGCKIYKYDGDNVNDSSKTDLTTMKAKKGYKASIMVTEDTAKIRITDGKKGLIDFDKSQAETANPSDAKTITAFAENDCPSNP